MTALDLIRRISDRYHGHHNYIRYATASIAEALANAGIRDEGDSQLTYRAKDGPRCDADGVVAIDIVVTVALSDGNRVDVPMPFRARLPRPGVWEIDIGTGAWQPNVTEMMGAAVREAVAAAVDARFPVGGA